MLRDRDDRTARALVDHGLRDGTHGEQVPVQVGVDDAPQVGVVCSSRGARRTDARARDESVGHPVACDRRSIAADTASGSRMSQSMSPPLMSHTTTSVPAVRSQSATARPIPDPPPVTIAVIAAGRSGRRGRRRGAVITAMATFFPPGAGISIRRTPSSKPRPASVAKRRLDIALQRQQEESERRTLGEGRGCRDAVQHHQFHDARIRSLRVAEEDRPQLIGRGAEEGRPVACERVVEQLGEAEAVAPETASRCRRRR